MHVFILCKIFSTKEKKNTRETSSFNLATFHGLINSTTNLSRNKNLTFLKNVEYHICLLALPKNYTFLSKIDTDQTSTCFSNLLI